MLYKELLKKCNKTSVNDEEKSESSESEDSKSSSLQEKEEKKSEEEEKLTLSHYLIKLYEDQNLSVFYEVLENVLVDHDYKLALGKLKELDRLGSIAALSLNLYRNKIPKAILSTKEIAKSNSLFISEMYLHDSASEINVLLFNYSTSLYLLSFTLLSYLKNLIHSTLHSNLEITERLNYLNNRIKQIKTLDLEKTQTFDFKEIPTLIFKICNSTEEVKINLRELFEENSLRIMENKRLSKNEVFFPITNVFYFTSVLLLQLNIIEESFDILFYKIKKIETVEEYNNSKSHILFAFLILASILRNSLRKKQTQTSTKMMILIKEKFYELISFYIPQHMKMHMNSQKAKQEIENCIKGKKSESESDILKREIEEMSKIKEKESLSESQRSRRGEEKERTGIGERSLLYKILSFLPNTSQPYLREGLLFSLTKELKTLIKCTAKPSLFFRLNYQHYINTLSSSQHISLFKTHLLHFSFSLQLIANNVQEPLLINLNHLQILNHLAFLFASPDHWNVFNHSQNHSDPNQFKFITIINSMLNCIFVHNELLFSINVDPQVRILEKNRFTSPEENSNDNKFLCWLTLNHHLFKSLIENQIFDKSKKRVIIYIKHHIFKMLRLLWYIPLLIKFWNLANNYSILRSDQKGEKKAGEMEPNKMKDYLALMKFGCVCLRLSSFESNTQKQELFQMFINAVMKIDFAQLNNMKTSLILESMQELRQCICIYIQSKNLHAQVQNAYANLKTKIQRVRKNFVLILCRKVKDAVQYYFQKEQRK